MNSSDSIIHVFVIDDSIVSRNLITTGISANPRIQVIGTASNAMEAKAKLAHLKPDVITLDVEMPGMSGIEFLRQYLDQNRVPVILVSSLNLRVFDALNAGAVDFVQKPDGTMKPDSFIMTLTQKIIIASCARMPQRVATRPVATLSLPNSLALSTVLIALGASTGGTEATLEVMQNLPANIPGMLIVQHMPVGFTKMYADRLNRICKMEVREAVNGDEIHQGLALIAPADYQMRVVRGASGQYQVLCTRGEKVSGHRPSVDVLFQSIADNVRCKTIGIIMTGMGHDGASGLLAMRRRGAYTIGQDEATSVVYGMPKVAYDTGAVTVQAACQDIATVLLDKLRAM